MPAAPRAVGKIGFGDCFYLFFLLTLVFWFLSICVFRLLYRIFGHSLHHTYEVNRLAVAGLIGEITPFRASTSSKHGVPPGIGPNLRSGLSLGVGARQDSPPCRRSGQLAGRCRGRADRVGQLDRRSEERRVGKEGRSRQSP